MQLKKSYKGFIVWIIAFLISTLGTSFLPINDAGVITRIVLNICTSSMALLTFIIYKTEYVYWYNGTTYEEALQVGSERRKIFAWRHFKKFGVFAIVYLVGSVVFHLSQLSIWIDIIFVTVGLVVTSVSTIMIKL